MKRSTLLVLLPILVAAAAFAAWYLSPTQQVKRATRGLLDTVSLDESTGQTARQMRQYSLNRRIAAEVTFATPTEANGTFPRADVEAGFSWLSNQAKSTRFEVHRWIEIQTRGNQATVQAEIDALVEIPSFRPLDNRHHMTLQFTNESDGWRLHSLEFQE